MEKLDVYSLGIVFHLILRGRYPESDEIKDSSESSCLEEWTQISSIVQSMIEKNPKKRVSFGQLMQEFELLLSKFEEKPDFGPFLEYEETRY